MTQDILDNRPDFTRRGEGANERGDGHAGFLAPELAEVAEAARFPEENPNPVFRVAADGRLLYANGASRPLLTAWGVDRDGCVPQPWLDLFAGALTGGEARKAEVSCDNRILQLHCVPISGRGYVNIYGADVTERIALEDHLREAEAKASDLIRYAPTGIYEVDFPSGRLRFVNDAVCEILGYSRDELHTMTGFDLLDDEGKQLFADRIRRTLAGEPVDSSVEYRVIRKDGSALYSVLNVRITHHDGRPDGAFVVAHDVTERRRAAQVLEAQRAELQAAKDELAERVEELEAVLDLLPTGIGISYNPECRDIRVNPALAKMLAVSLDANASLSADAPEREARYRVFDQTGRELGTEELPMQAAAMRGEAVRDQVVDILHENGGKLTLLSYAVPLFDGTGGIRGAVGAFADISPLRAAETESERLLAELQERNRELEAQAEQIRALNASLEQRVLERTAELEAVFASVPDAIYVTDENRVLRCNQATLDVFGCESLDELNDKRRERVSQMQPRYAGTGEPIPSAELAQVPALRGQRAEVEMTIYHRLSQQDRTYRVAAAPMELNGRVVAAVAVAADITEQKRNQLELAFQANLLANVSDAVIATDLEHRIMSLNRAAEEMFGWSQAEARGRPIQEILPSRFVDTCVEEVYRQLAEEGHWRGEMIVTCRDGREIHVDASGMPVRDARGRTIGQVGVNRDITTQKEARRQIEYLANLVENVNDAIFAYDVDLRITAWNKRAAEQYGWTAAEAIGADAREVVGSRMPQEQRTSVLRELSQGGRWQGEIGHTRRDGTPMLVEATAMRLCDEDGRVTGFVTVNRDITERKKAEDELRASREQLQALSRRLVTMQEAERSYVADQLYNQAGQVLAAVQMQLSRLGREGGRESPAEQLPHVQAMLQQAIGELHDLARELRPVGLDRSTLARVLAAYLSEFGRAHGLAVQFQAGAAETLRVPADVGTAIFRCVQEGLTNVARHAQASEVVLSLTARENKLLVTLADNGVGFGARVASEERRPGLGLAGIRERLETIGGGLTILSGKSGTTLTMETPLAGAA